MPEYPEVTTVTRELKKKVLGKEIQDIVINVPKIVKEIDTKKFQEKLKNQKIENIYNIGKHIIFELSENDLISHLRMEGKYYYYEDSVPDTKHDHIIFNFKDKTYLKYNDVRKFGTMHLISKNEVKQTKQIKKLGFEPLDSQITVQYLQENFANSTKKIKTALLDQSIINGLGNIYVDEILYSAKIHPQRELKSIKVKELKEFIHQMRIIIKEALNNNGTTIKSFSASDQVKGSYQDFLKVYQKQGQICSRCQSSIQRIKISGRSTHYCPQCQKI